MLWKAFLTAIATYSRIPVPQFNWNERSGKYALCFFPAVGLVCAAMLGCWLWLCERLNVETTLFAAIAVCLPLMVTGGIHLDGFMDTTDALASCQPREKKLAIMKDSHCGAFAVIGCAAYLLLSFGFLSELYAKGQVAVLLPGFVLSRALSGLCATLLPNARGSGMLAAVTADAHKKTVVSVLATVAVLPAGAMLLISPIIGGMALLCALLWFVYDVRMTMKQFGGVTGDTAGFFLQGCELALCIGAWIGGVIA
ncbi:MAG: adenosylcobinamide-GDP ribazoletransferase [Eubacteriales bacterium]|nr:adenosylcobinamide-GDP ribazoletransferase [Eubacteriales bacterium]